jgi:hypothetical protein
MMTPGAEYWLTQNWRWFQRHLTIREQKTLSEETVRFLFSLLREHQVAVPGVLSERDGARALRASTVRQQPCGLQSCCF